MAAGESHPRRSARAIRPEDAHPLAWLPAITPLVVVGVALGAVVCGGCVATGPARSSSQQRPFASVSTMYTESTGAGKGSIGRVPSYEEVIGAAKNEARDKRRRWPLWCELVLRGSEGKKVVVRPLTLENLRESGIEMESVEWIVLYGEPLDVEAGVRE